MTTPAFALAVAEEGSPFSQAAQAAKKEGIPTQKWEEDLASLTCELASKFYGTANEEMLRSGLAAADAILSVGLIETEGAGNSAHYLTALKKHGVKGLAAATLKLIHACSELPEDEQISLSSRKLPTPNRTQLALALIQTAQEDRPDAAQNALEFIKTLISSRKKTLPAVEAAWWLLDHTPTGRIIRQKPEAYFGADTATTEEVFLTIIPVHLGFVRLPTIEDIDPFKDGKEALILRLPAQELPKAKAAFERFVKKLPAEVAAGLPPNWFENRIKAKRAARKKPTHHADTK